MSKIESLFDKMKRNNIIASILIIDIISSFSYIVNKLALIIPADLDFLIGGIIGVIFALKTRKSNQSPFSLSLIVTISGGLLAAISMSLIEFYAHYLNEGLDFFLLILIFFILVGGVIGLLIGLISGIIASIIQSQRSSIIEDDFKVFKI